MAGLIFLCIFLSTVFIIWRTFSSIIRWIVKIIKRFTKNPSGSGIYKYDPDSGNWIDPHGTGVYRYDKEQYKYIRIKE